MTDFKNTLLGSDKNLPLIIWEKPNIKQGGIMDTDCFMIYQIIADLPKGKYRLALMMESTYIPPTKTAFSSFSHTMPLGISA